MLAVVALCAVVVVAGVVSYMTIGAREARSAATAIAAGSPARPSAATTVAAQQMTPALRSSAPTTPPAPAATAATTTALSSASDDPVALAAVDYPGAPAVEPHTINHMRPRHKYIAITIDDGYGFQPEMLALLQQYDVRCTTFLVGEWVATHKDDVASIKAAGFEVADHTWDHKTLTKLSDGEIRSELKRTQKAITSVTGNQAPYMRPPGGGTSHRVAQIAGDLGYTTVLWNRTFADSSKHASVKNAYHWVMEWGGGVHPGDIILCHWGSKSTFQAMKQILPELKAQGYEFVTLSQLIADSAPAGSGASSGTASLKKTSAYR